MYLCNKLLAIVGCSFLSVTTSYTQCGSGYVMPSAAAKAGLEIMTRFVFGLA